MSHGNGIDRVMPVESNRIRKSHGNGIDRVMPAEGNRIRQEIPQDFAYWENIFTAKKKHFKISKWKK